MTAVATATSPLPPSTALFTRVAPFLRGLLRSIGQLVTLLFVILTLLFVLVRVTGDPAVVLAGDYANAATLDAIRDKYGLDDSIVHQYVRFWANAVTLDFGDSLRNRLPAMELVLERMPATVLLTASGMAVNLAVAVPAGVVIAASRFAPVRRGLALSVFVAQGIPGYLAGLLLIQLLAVELRWLPSTGNTSTWSWVLPSLTIATFLAPKLIRVIAVNVGEAMGEDFVTMARAQGAGHWRLVARHALPNALLGATTLVGAQVATLLNGIVITETIFGWPGVGRLLLDSVLFLDFPVVQAVVLVTTVLVFLSNSVADKALELIDPRLRRA